MIKIRPLLRTTGLTLGGGHPLYIGEEIAGPTLPADMDFVYLAKNFDSTKVVNVGARLFLLSIDLSKLVLICIHSTETY